MNKRIPIIFIKECVFTLIVLASFSFSIQFLLSIYLKGTIGIILVFRKDIKLYIGVNNVNEFMLSV